MLGEGDDFVVVDDSMKDSGWVIVTTEEGDGYVSTVQAVPAVHQLLMRHRVDPMVRQLQAMQASLLVTHMSMVVPV